jgi:hypothetical protein
MLINTGRPACAKHTTHIHTAFWLFRRALSETAGLYSAAGEHYGQPENYCRNIYATTHTAHSLITASPPNLSRSFPFQFPAFKQQAAAFIVPYFSVTATRDAPGGLDISPKFWSRGLSFQLRTCNVVSLLLRNSLFAIHENGLLREMRIYGMDSVVISRAGFANTFLLGFTWSVT